LMRTSMVALITLLAAGLPAFAAGPSGQSFDWEPWRHLPVQDGGRYKPLDTLARESVQKITHRTRFTGPQTKQKLGPVALYLSMLFDWRGWDKPLSPHGAAMMHARWAYFESHQPDKWDRAPLIPVDSSLREGLGIDRGQQYVSPLELSEAQVQDPQTGKKVAFTLWAGKLARTERKKLSGSEEKALELAGRLWAYQDLRMGQGLEILPAKGDPDRRWVAVATLMRSDLNDQSDPTGGLREAKGQLQKARAAYLADSPQAFNQATAGFLAAVTAAGPRLGIYPPRKTIDLEVAYNRWMPFSLAWVFTSAAMLCLVLCMAVRWKPFYVAGLTALGASLVAMLVGFGVRTAISGRAPVTNLYESVVFMALGTVVFGLIFGLLSRKQYILTAAVAIATSALVLADCCPTVLDPSLRPLQPVLRSNFWLAVHVITIMLSYAAFAVALGIGNITLGYYLVGSQKQETIQAQSRFTYKALQAGVLLLEVGTILGALWADYSWGRFWGWDPKEVWALITLLSYLALLHARCAGWVGNLGLAALSVVCFAWVMMAWYGVNMLGTGLHNYGFSGGTGVIYVVGVVAAELLYVAAAAIAAAQRGLATLARTSPPLDQSSPQRARSTAVRTEMASP
jgi:ABC-type transport system involved in cytochrome c biogenesis permease subunit